MPNWLLKCDRQWALRFQVSQELLFSILQQYKIPLHPPCYQKSKQYKNRNTWEVEWSSKRRRDGEKTEMPRKAECTRRWVVTLNENSLNCLTAAAVVEGIHFHISNTGCVHRNQKQSYHNSETIVFKFYSEKKNWNPPPQNFPYD